MTKKKFARKKAKSGFFKFFVKCAAFLLIAVCLVFSVLSTGFVKPHIERYVSDAAGMDIKIHGNIGVGWSGFMPGLSVENVQVDQTVHLGQVDLAPALLKGMNAGLWRFYVDVQSLHIAETAWGDYSATVDVYANGGVGVPRLEGEIGSARLEATLQHIEGKFAAQGTLSRMPYAQLQEGMSGDFDVTIDLKGHGDVFEKVVPTLSGSVLLIGGKTDISSTALKLWTTDFLRILLSGQKSELALRCMVADMAVANGVASTNALFMDSDQMAVIGKGRVDLANRSLNIKLTPRPKGPTLVNLATPVRLQGTLDDIRVVPDAKEVAKTVGSALLSGTNPAAAFLTMVKNSSADKDICTQYLERRTSP